MDDDEQCSLSCGEYLSQFVEKHFEFSQFNSAASLKTQTLSNIVKQTNNQERNPGILQFINFTREKENQRSGTSVNMYKVIRTIMDIISEYDENICYIWKDVSQYLDKLLDMLKNMMEYQKSCVRGVSIKNCNFSLEQDRLYYLDKYTTFFNIANVMSPKLFQRYNEVQVMINQKYV